MNLIEVKPLYLYWEVYSDIKKDILTNHYRAGKPLPTQETLAKTYQTSRLTIKKALRILQDEGLIYSKQGSGSYVRARATDDDKELLPLDAPIGVTYSHRDQKITSKLLYFDARLPNETEQKNLVIKGNEPIYDIKRVRLVNGHYYSLEHTTMPTHIAPLDRKILKGSIYDYLGSIGIQLTDARRVLYATEADEETADALHIKQGSPVLVIEQTAYDQKGHAFEYSVSSFIRDHSRFVLNVHRRSPDMPH